MGSRKLPFQAGPLNSVHIYCEQITFNDVTTICCQSSKYPAITPHLPEFYKPKQRKENKSRKSFRRHWHPSGSPDKPFPAFPWKNLLLGGFLHPIEGIIVGLMKLRFQTTSQVKMIPRHTSSESLFKARQLASRSRIIPSFQKRHSSSRMTLSVCPRKKIPTAPARRSHWFELRPLKSGLIHQTCLKTCKIRCHLTFYCQPRTSKSLWSLLLPNLGCEVSDNSRTEWKWEDESTHDKLPTHLAGVTLEFQPYGFQNAWEGEIKTSMPLH